MDNYYELLEVNEKASKEIINKVFKMHIKKNHPDLYQGEEKKIAEEKIKKLNEAYEILNDDFKREEYDEKLSEEKKSIQYELEQEIDYLKNELVRKQKIIDNISVQTGLNVQDNDSQEYYADEDQVQNLSEDGAPEDYNYENYEEKKGVTYSYLKDIKIFLKKAGIIIIAFLIFCLGIYKITGVSILKKIFMGSD